MKFIFYCCNSPIYNIYNPLLFFLVLCLYISTCLLAADKLIPLFHHIASTFWAFLCGWLLPGHKIAFRIILTPEIFSAFFLHRTQFLIEGHCRFIPVKTAPFHRGITLFPHNPGYSVKKVFSNPLITVFLFDKQILQMNPAFCRK
mgnify:CR=1 FL=1